LKLASIFSAAKGKPANENSAAVWLVARGVAGFAVLWLLAYAVFRSFPYLTAGAEVVYQAKLRQEFSGQVFAANSNARRILIFGDSRVLAGFIPSRFDTLAAADGLSVSSYNSGYPAVAEFVTQLKRIASNSAATPNILLLTMPWKSASKNFDPFHPLPDDHDIADRVFPFHFLIRDTASFFATAREHGGVQAFYRESRENEARMLRDRGYYFISEQSHFPNNRLPDTFHLDSDNPQWVFLRSADPESKELADLNAIILQHGIQCYYVPAYMRAGLAAAAPDVDEDFAALLQRYSSCKLLGPDYYLYPNHMFSDQNHLNSEGAAVYTEAIYRLLAQQLRER